MSRPAGSSPENRWGNNQIGPRGNDNFFHPEVVAANNFRQRMVGEKESLYYSADGKVMEVARGKKGAALINLGEAGDISIKTCLPDGSYTDTVHKAYFDVQKGMLKGHVEEMSSYILEVQK